MSDQPRVVEYAMNTTGMTAEEVAAAQSRFDEEDYGVPPLPFIVGRVDTAPLAEVIAWAQHPYIGSGGLMDEVVRRLIRELQECGRC